MDYRLKINKRRVKSGATLRAHLVAKDAEGHGKKTGTLDVSVVINPEKIPDREYCLRRKAKIDSALTTSNPNGLLIDRINGLKENVGIDDETLTNAKVVDVVLENGQEGEDITDYIDLNNYGVLKHPVYTGLGNDSVLTIRASISIQKNDTIETYNKQFILTRYTKDDVMTQLQAKLTRSQADYASNLFWNLIKNGNSSPDNCWRPISDSLLEDALTNPTVGASHIDTSVIYNILSEYTAMTPESLPTFKLKWDWNNGAPYGYVQEGEGFTFTRPAAARLGSGTDSITDVPCSRPGDSNVAPFTVGKLITNDRSFFYGRIEYDPNHYVEIKSPKISIRSLNVNLADVETNVSNSMRAYWYGLDADTYDSRIAASGDKTIDMLFGSEDYVAIKIPLTVKGLSQSNSDGTVIADTTETGYSLEWIRGALVEKGFNTSVANAMTFNVLNSRVNSGNSDAVILTMEDGHSEVATDAFGYILRPSDVANMSVITSEALSTIVEDNDNVSLLTKNRLNNIHDEVQTAVDYVYLVFSKALFTEKHIKKVTFAHKLTIQGGYNVGSEEMLSTWGFTPDGNATSIDNTVNFSVALNN